MTSKLSGDETPQSLDPAFRNGSITAVGLLTGFSLTFLTTWAAIPGRWQLYDVFGLTPMVVGSFFELVSIALLLSANSLARPRYDLSVRWFLIGLALVIVGITISISGDAVGVVRYDVG